jgi:hypothetical protein
MIIFHLTSYTDQLADDGTEFTKRPYPYGVDAEGKIVGRHDEVRAIGFQNDPAHQRIDMDWWTYVHGEPDAAVGRYLITADTTGRYATNVCAIERVEVR